MNNNIRKMGLVSVCMVLLGCNSSQNQAHEQKIPANVEQTASSETVVSTAPSMTDQAYQVQKIAVFKEPWAMASLPDGRLLITEKAGVLKLFDPSTQKSLTVQGTPKVAYGGQGGLGDVTLHPNFTNNAWIYLSYAEAGQKNQFGAVVMRAKLDLSQADQPKLVERTRIWEQVPKVEGQGHYSHRLVFDEQTKLWISSGERQQFDPAQDMNSNLGKVLRLNDDGTPAANNPFAEQGGIAAQIWSLGHRNPLGFAFDPKNQLWVVEMGPKGGDEMNLVEKAQNYGYPIVSNGDHYDGKDIPDHHTRPEFRAPDLDWTPVISPSSLMFYRGNQFSQWKNRAMIGGLSSKAIIVVDTEQKPIREVQRLDMGQRIRDLMEAKDGAIWVLEDGPKAQLLKLVAPEKTP